MKQYAAVDDTVYFWFAGNDTSGTGGDGASPAADVRLAGAAADVAPVYSPTPSLLSHVNYPAGAYEIAIVASAGNGFAVDNTYAVFCTLAIDSQNPTGFVGSFDLKPVESNVTQIGDTAQSLTDLKDFADAGYDPGTNKITGTADMRGTDSAALASEYTAGRAAYLDNLSAGAVALAAGVDLTSIHGAALTETVNGYLAAAFVKLFDVVTPVLTSESVNQSANNNTILAHADYGNAKLVRSTTPANALDVSATGEAGLDFANIKDATGAHTLTNITVPTVSALTGKTGFALSATGANLILKDSTFALAIADAIWDEILTGATHNIVNSAGLRVRQIGAYAIHDGTAQAGNATCITLAATASAIDGTYNRNLLVLTDNTGAGQTRTIIDYDGSTKIAIIDREWRTNPDATTVYQIVADDTPLVVDQGVAQAGSTSSTIKLRAYASSINDTYLCNIVIIVAGTGRGQARLVGAYDGTSKVVTLCGDNWVTTPDDTSVYVMIPYGTTCTSCVGDDALAQINAEVDTALNTAIPGSPTAESINQRIKAIDELTEGSGSGDLAAILIDTNTTIPGTISTLQTDSTAIKAKTDNLPDGIKKNTAYTAYTFLMVDSTDHVTAKTGLTVAGSYTGDGSAVASLTNTGAITEISNGLYEIDLTAGELNYNNVHLIFTSSGADARVIGIHTSI
jgi:hypothetical protein